MTNIAKERIPFCQGGKGFFFPAFQHCIKEEEYQRPLELMGLEDM